MSFSEKLALGNIGIMFGTERGKISIDKILSSYKITAPGNSKIEKLGYVFDKTYNEDVSLFIDFILAMINAHSLSEKRKDELGSNLSKLGIEYIDDELRVIPSEEDFFTYFDAFLNTPQILPGKEGDGDGAIITFVEKLNGMTSEFNLVDFGCGNGRFIHGLQHLNDEILEKMNYVGVDIEKECLEETLKSIEETGFKDRVKSYELFETQKFLEKKEKNDIVIVINVLHEIDLINLPDILHSLGQNLKHNGHLIVHEMRDLREGEINFITWESKDFLDVFEGTNMKPYIHAYKTKRGFPLINVDLIKQGEEEIKLADYVDNCFIRLYNKLNSIREELKIIKASGDINNRYAFLLVLKDNIETQISNYEEFELSNMNKKDPFYGLIKCPDCGSRKIEKHLTSVPGQFFKEIYCESCTTNIMEPYEPEAES
jgi:2-polyprenyl-3-methyl-5-hydroxy-6-metoxy-1,4-benzoquinol methylase